MTANTEDFATIEAHADGAAAILDAGRELGALSASPRAIEPGPVYVSTVPDGYVVNVTDSEQYAATPRRAKATPTLTTTGSFVQYVNAHKDDGTVCYADVDSLTVKGVINDLGPGQVPAWRDHVATLRLTKTPAWLRWGAANGRFLAQDDFAELIDEGITEIAQPAGADLLELAQSIKASTSAQFRSDRRLTNGRTQLTYVEEIDARAGADGTMEIPSEITLVLAPFFGAPDVTLKARLRYRIGGGKLALGVWLVRASEVLRDSFDAELRTIEEGTQIRPLWGVPG